MSSRPWMPLYIPDYRADTAHLSTEQHGAYLLLLMSMWVAGGYLPDEPVKLARVSGLSLKRWRNIAADIMPLFVSATEGRITHKRVRKELSKIGAVSEVRVEAGRKGGHAKRLRAGTSQLDSTNPAGGQSAPDKQLNLLDADKAIAKSEPSKNGFDSRARARLYTHNHNQTEDEDSLRSDERQPDPEAEFALWYRHYPLKRARGQAERAFRAARKIASLQELIDGVERYKREKRADRDWRYPATWLNGKDWLDEPEPEPVYQSTGPPAHQSREDAERAAWNKVLDDAAKGKSNG